MNLNINGEDLSKVTNNYDLRLIDKTTWNHEVTKESLVAFVKEIPENHYQWQHTFILTVLVYGMVLFFHLAEGVLLSWVIVYNLIKILVALFITFTFTTAITHILSYQKVQNLIHKTGVFRFKKKLW